MPTQQFFSYIMTRTSYNFQRDDYEVHFVLEQHAQLDLYSATSLKQQSSDRHVTSLGHIIQANYSFSKCCMLSGEATNTNFIVFGLTRPGLEPTIYYTRDEHTNHYATDAFTSVGIFDLQSNDLQQRFYLLRQSYTKLGFYISHAYIVIVSDKVSLHF